MKYVTRAAPLPPVSQKSSNISSHQIASNKPKPPRPPPPRATNSESKPAVKEQSMKLFSNLFGATKKSSNKSNEKLSQMEVKLPPPRIPPPVTQSSQQRYNTFSNTSPVQQISNEMQLINFDDSPPESPAGFIKKSNTGGSDSVSMDSFCSTNSSPNNFGLNSGTTSQAER